MIQSIFGRKPDPAPAQPLVTELAAGDKPAKPPRQMVDLSDIAPPEPEPDPMDRHVDNDGDPELRELVLEAARTVRDPEIPVNLLDLGLIYDLSVDRDGSVAVEMTLTTPNCPSAAQLPAQMKEAIAAVEGVTDVSVKVVFTPPWDQSMMSEEARLELGMM